MPTAVFLNPENEVTHGTGHTNIFFRRLRGVYLPDIARITTSKRSIRNKHFKRYKKLSHEF